MSTPKMNTETKPKTKAKGPPIRIAPDPATAPAARRDPAPARRQPRGWSLTALWRRAGSPPHLRPAEWRRYRGRGFLADLAATPGLPEAGLIRGGRGSGTWAHPIVALEYARALDPGLHRQMLQAYGSSLGQGAPPARRVADRLARFTRRLGSPGHAAGRLAAIDAYNRRRRAIRLACAGLSPGGWGRLSMLVSAEINRRVIGGSAAQLRRAEGAGPAAKTRDLMGPEQLEAVVMIELLLGTRLAGLGRCTPGEVLAEVARIGAAVAGAAARSLGEELRVLHRRRDRASTLPGLPAPAGEGPEQGESGRPAVAAVGPPCRAAWSHVEMVGAR